MQRIVSFLPSATEMLFALGAGDQVAGVTFECDFPPGAISKPKVVHSHLPPGLSPQQIDSLVRSEGAANRSLYFVDLPALEALEPDLIVLQDLCRVCAIDSPTLERDLRRLPTAPDVLSLSAHTLDAVWCDIARVGNAIRREAEAGELVASLRQRLRRCAGKPLPGRTPRVLALEWLDPFFQGGHWVPEMITLAGGDPVLAVPGEKSRVLSMREIEAADADIILIMPCGYHLPETIRQYREQLFPAEWYRLRAVRQGSVFAVDGSAFFSRPGPRLVDGVELLARIFRAEPGEHRLLS